MSTTLTQASAEIALCKAADIFDDIDSAELLAEYGRECANALLGKPGPRRDVYENLEMSGMGQCFSVREAGRLVGFAFIVIAVVPHYSMRLATTESLFVSAAARDGGPGWDLIRALGTYARMCGAEFLFLSAPVGSRLARLLFLSEDVYTHVAETFCRRLV